MTLKTKCVCGREFYVSMSTENAATMSFAQERFHEWLDLHKTCGHELHREQINVTQLIR